MSLKAGIIGMPNVGKSTLFNAITKKGILAANYPFATIDPNVGVVTVPDHRLEKLSAMFETKKEIPTAYEFIDIAGLVKGASTGEGLGNKFLSNIREVDAIVQVVRCFEDSDIIHVEGNIDPIRDIEIINLELTISDLEIVETRLNKIEKKAIATKNKEELYEVKILHKLKEELSKNIPARMVELDEDELKCIKAFNLITLKPIIYLANVDDDNILGNSLTEKVKEYADSNNSELILMSAKLESELAELDDEEKIQFLNDLGIEESGLDSLIKATYKLLGLKTFFTAGVQECRAWTFESGTKAPGCAGIIHTDFEKGFIRAEVTSYEDLVKYGSELKAKEAGRMRLEGKDYEMQDGDVCYFRFNV